MGFLSTWNDSGLGEAQADVDINGKTKVASTFSIHYQLASLFWFISIFVLLSSSMFSFEVLGMYAKNRRKRKMKGGGWRVSEFSQRILAWSRPQPIQFYLSQ